jgi:hypothetical protein
MFNLDLFAAWAIACYNRAAGREPERGDVPGWVMVTVMTAGLVVVVFTVFKGRITSAINDAIDSVVSGTK